MVDRMNTFNHVDLVVSSLERSLPFYRELLRRLDHGHEEFRVKGERGESIRYLGRLGLRDRQSEGAVDRYAVGLHHVAFDAPSRAAVDDVVDWLRGIGAAIESGPCEWDYTPGYYAVFFSDPDGIKLEVVHQPG
jgi:glyoxylase I family protein